LVYKVINFNGKAAKGYSKKEGEKEYKGDDWNSIDRRPGETQPAASGDEQDLNKDAWGRVLPMKAKKPEA
jgi:hypothetical protein